MGGGHGRYIREVSEENAETSWICNLHLYGNFVYVLGEAEGYTW